MKNTGNPNQWADDYPSDNLLMEDIRHGNCLVGEKSGMPVATFVLREGNDPTYKNIYNGTWLNEQPYATIHRIASNGKTRGFLHQAVLYASFHHSNIRIDTHRDNKIMQHLLQKEGFSYCGIIKCWNGSERLAYQRVNDQTFYK